MHRSKPVKNPFGSKDKLIVEKLKEEKLKIE
jgi:hypothetical protein